MKPELKPGDIVYQYIAEPDWFEEPVEVAEAVRRGVVIDTDKGLRVAAFDCRVQNSEWGGPDMADVFPVKEWSRSIQEAIKGDLEATEGCATEYQRQLEWMRKTIKELSQ